MDDAMREQQERFHEELQQQQMTFLQQQLEYMAAQRIGATSNERECVIYSHHGQYLSYN
jgi:hypothetical protein